MTNGTNGDTSNRRKVFGLIGTLSLVALGVGAYWYLNRGPTPDTMPNPTPVAAPTEPVVNAGGGDTPVANEPTESRKGLVLQDDISSHEKEFDEKSPKIEDFHTGDQVTVYDRKWKTTEGGDSAYLAGREKRGWIDGKHVLVPEEVGALDIFITSTPPLAETMRGTPQDEQNKLAVLDSKEFLIRCARNPRSEAASPCIKRYFYMAPKDSVIRWIEMALDEKVVDKATIGTEQYSVLTSGLPNTEVSAFIAGFQKFPDDLKKHVWEYSCGAIAQSRGHFQALLKVTAKASNDIFEAFAHCVNETVVLERGTFPDAVEVMKRELKAKTFTPKQRKLLRM